MSAQQVSTLLSVGFPMARRTFSKDPIHGDLMIIMVRVRRDFPRAYSLSGLGYLMTSTKLSSGPAIGLPTFSR